MTDIKKSTNKNKSIRLILLIVIGLLLVGTATVGTFSYRQLAKITPVSLDKTPQRLGISTSLISWTDSLEEPPVNIALFGLDKRPADKFGNSDAIMIISISKAANKIKLSSIMRDTYVKIDSLGMDKINAAFREGGAQLALKTINQNFNLNIKNFVSVDLNGMASVIDALDGVSIDVKQEEVNWLNAYLSENHRDPKVKAPYISKAGLQNLNGKQAVAYTRIRQVGGEDYQRTQRQRTVLSLLLKKLKEAGPSEYPKIVSKVSPYVDTSIPRMELLSLGATVFLNNIRTLEERRFPGHTESKGKFINGHWYLVADLPATSKSLRDFIFEGCKPE